MFAGRTAWNLSPNRLARLLEKRRASCLPTLDLTDSNPTRCGLRYPEAAILQALGLPGSLSYEPCPRGLPAAREAVAADYAARGAAISPDDLVLTASTSEAYGFLFRLLADPGDTVLVPAPCYPLFELLARIHDVTLRHYALSEEDGFSIDIDSLTRAAESGARALLIVSPGNPTGAFLKRPELDSIAELCSRRGIPIICDEVFGDYDLCSSGDRVSTTAGQHRTLTFTLNGLSKMLALPQIKLGWICVSGPDEARRESLRRLEVIADTYLSVATPVQVGLPDLLSLRPAIQREVMGRLRMNRNYLEDRAAPGGSITALPSEGGWCAVLSVPRTRTDEAWALEILDRAGVHVHPGYFFDFPGEGHLVVSLLPRPEDFAEGLDRLLRCVESGLAGGA